MKDWLATRAALSPEALALRFEGESWTYAALDAMADGIAAGLQAYDVQPGTRVGVYLPCQPHTAATVHALARIGAVQVPLNRRLTPAELAWQIANADCALALVDTPIVGIETAQITLDALPAGGPVLPQFALEHTQAIFYTSGTTGTPKGAMLSFANHQASTLGTSARLGVNDDDRWLLCMPLYHIGGQSILLRAAQYGMPVILQDGFEATATYGLLRDDAVTFVSLVPTMLHRLLPLFAADGVPDSLRIVLLGGAAATPDLIERAHALKLPIALTYGLTEACSQVATATPAEVRAKPGTVGQPLYGTEVRIDAPDGSVGEILVKGPTVMQGYFENPAATAAALADGWLRTGDLGRVDDDGDLWVVNRRSDLIVSGGENVYPSEVEAALLRHPAVRDACVVGLADEEWGQRVAAAVILDDAVDSDELIDFCREHLAGYKCPRQIRMTDAFPRTASGKVMRQQVRDQFEQPDRVPVQPVRE